MSYISIKNISKDYGNGCGNFDISFDVPKGKTIGIVGINGAGKTTLIRQIMGFIKSQKGSITINGLDAWKDSAQLKEIIGYIPGEIAFPQLKKGITFIKGQAEFLGVKDIKPTLEMIDAFRFNINANLKRMSKGMKQKTAIVESFMADPDILIFDEPSTGLDPLMEKVFIEYVKQEKNKGKTIIMSSHIFEEVEECCDEVIMLNKGKIIEHIEMAKIRHNPTKTYRIGLADNSNFSNIIKDKKFKLTKKKKETLQVFAEVNDKDINNFIKNTIKYKILFLTEIKYTLEEHFLKIYGDNTNGGRE